ncbi:MAG: phenylalanine--tRNA ligase subunit beta [Porphyromonas sp.]|nr:phenylalanine--tRNA ligase subunit beta [Porphyromonas sp.]
MNVSYNWLRKYVELGELTPEEVGKILTSIGLEVESVEKRESILGGLRGVVIGKVVTCVEHSNSDHLHVTMVDLGSELTPDGPIQIVCGAPNIAAGQTVPVATVGTTLYTSEGEPFVIKKGKIRGEVSEGMICSADELGVGSDSSGIMVLPDDIPAGTLASDYFGVESDYVIGVDITPNRVDGTSHYGVARDLHAYLSFHGYTTSLKKPTAPEVSGSGSPIKVSLQSPEACYRYAGVVIKGLEVKESPKWLKDALELIGQKSINNVVDASNYILHDIGQPLHTFDLAKIEGGEIRVRLAHEGERLTTLDGVERELMDRDLVIADATKPLCLAGVMGGENSGVTETTTDIFLEVATFHPTYIRKSARRYGINSDASFRYERGLDPNTIPAALRQAVALIIEVAGGQVASEVYDIYPTPMEESRVSVSLQQINQLLGLAISRDEVVEILEVLEIKVLSEREGVFELSVPRYRYDVTRDIDVIEEIFRIYGYNEFPEQTDLHSSLTDKTETDESIHLQQIVSEQLVGAGFNEILNNSLSDAGYYAGVEGRVELENPLSSELSTMRMTLLHGGLEVIEYNLNRRATGLRLFEFGNVYRKSSDKEKTPLAGYKESYRLGLWMTGDKAAHNWAVPDREVMPYELKAHLQNVLTRMGLNDREMEVKAISNDDLFVKGEEIKLRGGGTIVKWGIVDPKLSREMHDIDFPVYFAEIEWREVMKRVLKREVTIQPVAKFPSVKRDFALLLDAHVTFGQVEQVAREVERKLLKSVALFDVYDDPKHLPEGKKSYAVTFDLQDKDKTLSDKVIDKTMQKIYEALHKKLGAELR